MWNEPFADSRGTRCQQNRKVTWQVVEPRREVLGGACNSINTQDQKVITSAQTLDYDYLVIALGAQYDWNAVPGSKDAYSFYDFDYARRCVVV
ncbi:MAG: hypothetical protein Ct9H300mP19_16760 [Dehalococcoidia bacterium]|nr:MAG: hypothetical protein Ct9H300mP19_16760 [Dehalococcoidia bacterium]